MSSKAITPVRVYSDRTITTDVASLGHGCPPPIPSENEITDAHRALTARARQRVKQLVLSAVDRGWFGLTPLEAHVVICGFPRSGTTLLQLMVEACVADIKVFGREATAIHAAQHAWRNHSFMLTKEPPDLFHIDAIRKFYAKRRAKARFVVMLRDPRGVLTSIHERNPGAYFLEPEVWRGYYEHFQYVCESEDVLVIRFTDIVSRPTDVERRLSAFVGWKVKRPFDQYYENAPKNFDGAALNGVRPPDRNRIDNWRSPEHRQRIGDLLVKMPELPAVLIELGYEPDTSWICEYETPATDH